MARGDLTVFEEAKAYMIDGGWEPADVIWIGLVSDDPVNANDGTPSYGAGGGTAYTPSAAGGNYAADGELLDTLGAMVTELGGVMTFDDTGGSVTWAQDPANPVDAEFAVIYNTDRLNFCIAMTDLDGPINMRAGDLTITWNGSGIFTIT